MPSSVLVTGGAGFIGSHVTEALLARGDQVVCLDNLDPYYDPTIKRRNLEAVQHEPLFAFVEGDMRDPRVLSTITASHSFDAVIHLAARAGVRPSIVEPALYSDVNLAGTTNLLELCRTSGIERFVFASSSSVYGERRDAPFRESDRVDHPVSPYAATKKAGELLCHTYHHLYGLDVSCLRFFTVYGPRQRPEMAIHKFTRLIDEGRPVPIYGDGSAERDFTYVDDIVAGILAALDRHRGYGVFNLGNHRQISVGEMVLEIADALGVEPEIDYLPAQPGDVTLTCADIEHSRETLGYTPATSFRAGIRNFVDWYVSEKALIAG